MHRRAALWLIVVPVLCASVVGHAQDAVRATRQWRQAHERELVQHYMDMLRWSLGKEYPRAVTAMGGKYAVQDDREIPDTMEAMWEFEGGGTGPTMVIFAQYNANAAPGNNMPGSEMELDRKSVV